MRAPRAQADEAPDDSGLSAASTKSRGRGKGYRLRGAAVTVCKAFNGSVTVLREGRELPVRLLNEGEEAVVVGDEKTVQGRVDRVKTEQLSRLAYKPAPDHPWRQPLKPGTGGIAAG